MKTILKNAIKILQAAEVEAPETDARILLAYVLGIKKNELFLYDKPLSPVQEKSFNECIGKRAKRMPVSRIIGTRGFWKLDFVLNEDTLDPRPDSETLIEAVLENYDASLPLRFLDLGTGTGCLLLSLLYEFKNATGTGIDIAANAVKAAKKNALRNNLASRSTFLHQSWQDFIPQAKEKFDVIVSNPPYIPNKDLTTLSPEVKYFDPTKALDGGGDGLVCYREISLLAKQILSCKDMLFCETGQGQEQAITDIFKNNGFKKVKTYNDLQHIPRVLAFKL